MDDENNNDGSFWTNVLCVAGAAVMGPILWAIGCDVAGAAEEFFSQGLPHD